MRIHSMVGAFSRLAVVAIVLAAAGCVDSTRPGEPAGATGDDRSTASDVDRAIDNPTAASFADEGLAEIGGGGDPACCQYGSFRCPATGAIFEYDALACEPYGIKKTTAASRCDAACNVACTDSGWIDPCP